VQGVDLTRVLDRVPGLTWSRTGGLGAQTAVRLRGGEGQHTLVLVDGVRVEDPSAPSGGFDFGTLTSSGIERIEVLRGSNSVVWGSSAIGGVIAVTTREIDGVEASAEAGSRRSYDADAVAGVKREAYAFSLNGGYATTDGVSAAPAAPSVTAMTSGTWAARAASISPTRSRWSPPRAMPMARPRSMAMTRISISPTPRNTPSPGSSSAAPGCTMPAAR
jgi:outer membrane cobalamin receptor